MRMRDSRKANVSIYYTHNTVNPFFRNKNKGGEGGGNEENPTRANTQTTTKLCNQSDVPPPLRHAFITTLNMPVMSQ